MMSIEIVTSDQDEAEASRLSQRAAVKRQLAELRLQEAKVAELQEVIRTLELRIDAADREHAEACEPLQEQLAELHEKQLDSIVNNREPDADDQAKRQELQQRIADANSELEKTVQAHRATIQKVESEIRELQKGYLTGSNSQTCQNKLADGLAKPEWRFRSFALQQRIRMLNASRENAQSWLEKFQGVLGNAARYDQHAVLDARNAVGRWSAVAADAGQLATEATAELQRLRQQAIDE